jgi:hypothetical protein
MTPMCPVRLSAEGETERLRGEDRFVVRSGDARLAVAPVGLDELLDHRPARFALQRFEPKCGATGVLQDGKGAVSRLTEVNLAGEVQTPNEVLRHGSGFAILDSALLQLDQIPMFADQLVDEGSADGHMFLAAGAPIEAPFYCPASAGFPHEGLEADDFASYPGRLGSARNAGRIG